MTLFWALLLPLWHPPIGIMPYYLYAIVEKVLVQVMPGHCNAPPPQWGAGLAQGRRSSLEKRVSQEHIFFNLIKVKVPAGAYRFSSPTLVSKDYAIEQQLSGLHTGISCYLKGPLKIEVKKVFGLFSLVSLARCL